MSGATIRRQSHGIRVAQTTITISRKEMTRLRREAAAKEVSFSRHVIELIRQAWGVPVADEPEEEEEALTA